MARQRCQGGCGRVTSRHSTTGFCAACSQAHQAKTRRKGANPAAEGSALSVTGDKGALTVVTPDRVQTLADLIRVCQIDTDEWTVERWVANKWEMGSSADGTVTTTPLYQIKAWLVRNRPVVDAKARIVELVADAKRALPAPRKTPAIKPPADGHLLELAVPDLHLGKLAWQPETGYADYDLKIAESLFRQAVDALMARVSAFPLARIVLPVGHDFFHADNKHGTTTKGTPLDVDSRYHKAFLTGRRLLVDTIQTLARRAPVTVVVVPGNHDTLAAFHLGDALECWFHADTRVTVMNAPIARKYVAFGTTALMFTHGDKGKVTDYPLLFATEQPEMFAGATFREIHTGHLHTTRLIEKMGVRVRISPALCSPDEWHAANHYVGNVRGAEALVYHPDEGLVCVAHFTVKEAK